MRDGVSSHRAKALSTRGLTAVRLLRFEDVRPRSDVSSDRDDGQVVPETARNVVSGPVHGIVVQADQITGDIHVHATDRRGTKPTLIPVEQLKDPFALEVHPAIDLSSRIAGLPVLPHYVARAHDGHLRRAVENVLSGVSMFVVLAGGSSTGKTRACWEAVKLLPEGWSLWHPIFPSRPQALLDGLREVGPNTVIWLNELQHYLVTAASSIGEEVAAGLRAIMRDKERSPILLLGTIWPDYLDVIMRLPVAEQADSHSQARALIAGTIVKVPSEFGSVDADGVMEAAERDPRMREAVNKSQGSRLAQYLAGAPALVERYTAAPDYAQVLIDAAHDARRFGLEGVSEEFLERAAPGYFSNEAWQYADDDWFEKAMSFGTAACRGAMGLLVRRRERVGRVASESSSYQVADFLAQWLARERYSSFPPIEFWDAAILCVNSTRELIALGDAAEKSFRKRHAHILFQRAADFGDDIAWVRLGQLWESIGNVHEAKRLYGRAATSGNVDAQCRLGWLLAHIDDRAGAKYWYEMAANQGDARAFFALAEMERDNGERARAVQLYLRVVELDYGSKRTRALRALAALKEESGAASEAVVLRAKAAGGVQTYVRRSLADIQQRSGGEIETERRTRERIAAREADGFPAGYTDLEILAEICDDKRDYKEAESIAAKAAAEGWPDVLLMLAVRRYNQGDVLKAERLARGAADAGDSYGLRELARVNPDDDRWRQIGLYGIEPDGRTSDPWF